MTINPQIFREYDIRGIAGRDLNEDFYRIMGKSLATYLAGKTQRNAVVVGYDGRLTSPDYARAAIQGLRESGLDVIDIGQVPSPLLYYALFTQDVDGGIMVTASHNPKDYNGLKVAVGESTLHGDEIQKLREIAERGEFVASDQPGAVTQLDLSQAYIDRIVSDVNVKRKLKVVVDAGNGAAGPVAVPLFERLGCEVIPLFCDVDGHFPNHHPDPTVPEYLTDCVNKVLETGADCGIGFDGDGDRIGAVDEKGNVIYGDRLLILFARSVLLEEPGATIIGEVKCSRTLFEDIKARGGNPIMYKTGHSLIKAAMKKYGAEVAGEMSGHMFFQHRWYGFDDAMYSAARLLELLGAGKETLSEHLADVPDTFVTPEIRLETEESKKFEIVEEATKYFRDELGLHVNTIDGVRIEFQDGWGLLRASNTSPVLVMRCEAMTKDRLQEIRDLIESKVNELQGK